MNINNNEDVNDKTLPSLVRIKRNKKKLTLQNLCNILNVDSEIQIRVPTLSEFERSLLSEKSYMKYRSQILAWYQGKEVIENNEDCEKINVELNSSDLSSYSASFKFLRQKFKLTQANVAKDLTGKTIKYNQNVISQFERNLLSVKRMQKIQQEINVIYISLYSRCSETLKNSLMKPLIEVRKVQKSNFLPYMSPPYTPDLFSDILNPASPCNVNQIQWQCVEVNRRT